MPTNSAGFTFATGTDFLFFLSDGEAEEQTTLDSMNRRTGGDAGMLDKALNSASQEMLMYLSAYSLPSIENNSLLKRINCYISNWALEIYGIREAQQTRYDWAVRVLKELKGGAPLYDETGKVIPPLDASLTPQADGVDYGLDLGLSNFTY
jgi:phage gp36-like protein